MTFVCKVMLYLLAATYAETVRSVKQERSTSHHVNEWVFSQNKKNNYDNTAPRGLLQGRYSPSPQSFPENAGPYGSGFASTSVGSASHETHPVLAEAEGSIRGLASRTPPHNGDSGLCISPGPLEGPLLAKARRDPRHGAQKEGCHDRRFQQGLGSTVRGQTCGPKRSRALHINCLEMLAVCQACQFFLPDIRGHHVVIRSDSRSVVSYINHHGGLV